MAGIEIVAVEKGPELKDFIDLPWRIYAEYPNWVPPLKKEVRRMLDPHRHPFWESSERVLFLARRGSETAGRIAGIIDRHYNQFHNEKMGSWGFFECVDDPEVAAALFSSVEAWVSRKGMTFMRGPLNPSTNYEVGLLIEGFNHPPALMMAYNPPYYPRLVESCGFTKEKDLLAFLIDGDYRLPEWMEVNSTSKCTTEDLIEQLVGRLVVEALPGSIIQFFYDKRNMFSGYLPEVGSLWKVVSE